VCVSGGVSGSMSVGVSGECVRVCVKFPNCQISRKSQKSEMSGGCVRGVSVGVSGDPVLVFGCHATIYPLMSQEASDSGGEQEIQIQKYFKQPKNKYRLCTAL
jgi:hypothetical protein